jgi:hypothetical protein
MTIKRSIAPLLLSLAIFTAMDSYAQKSQQVQGSQEVTVELRSATGSNRFQVGEVIPLELVFSTLVPSRYLEPCLLLYRSCFGYFICRFPNKWKFSITPEQGWVDLMRPCQVMSGPTFAVPDHDLTVQPAIIPYELTSRFRFDKPGKYTVHFTTDIGLDDDSNPRHELLKETKKIGEPHSITVSAELQLEIVVSGAKWRDEIVRKGFNAYLKGAPPQTNPPSPELLQYQKDTKALCELGTPDAAHALVELLSRGVNDVTGCLDRSASIPTAVAEMERLLSDPDAEISQTFFRELLRLKSSPTSKSELLTIARSLQEEERDRLIAALPHKRGNALTTSLLAVLQNPPISPQRPGEFSYPLPFPDWLITMTAENFEQFPDYLQKRLLTTGWEPIRSPIMAPTVRRLAEKGNGEALLRWQELDTANANAFEKAEVLSASPRFSSFYLRLPESLSPQEKQQLANHFVTLAESYKPSQPISVYETLIRLASLLHRYSGSEELPTILRVIDAHRSSWSCAIELPALAYVLKVSPDDAVSMVASAIREANHGPCNTSSFFTELGFLEHGPVLERFAFEQLADNAGTPLPFARDAAEYLRLYAPANAKQRVWERLAYWQHQWEEIRKKTEEQHLSFDQLQVRAVANDLSEAYIRAQGWMLTTQDEEQLRRLIGEEGVANAACSFHCGENLSIPRPASFYIYMRPSEPHYGQAPVMDYLNPQNAHRFAINQYKCPDMQPLEDKLLQFPAGSTFDFAYDFSSREGDEILEITEFLNRHGYKVKNSHNWDFLLQDASQ